VAKTLGKRAQFTVNLANRAHIMGILSGLYADPIKAVIRELSVNANESHKASGNKSPIKVTFPSTSGPTFIIKDEGLGLDIDEFGKLMASYGSSGEYKSTSNEYTGGFGLGCKAPAAYTDQWTITCIKGGKKWVLVCFKDEFGVPSFDTLEESETDEPNGVEVKLPVKANDVERFRSTAVEVFNVFRVKPRTAIHRA
jgi:HSP90 family molecular chaperone